ncbi:MAG: PTS sugar transporter subunit IIA [Piscirickettsiaceae bacterium]|nr:PTS sugar transporter subunit IIA [Piscirickettsiaceae bacterium]
MLNVAQIVSVDNISHRNSASSRKRVLEKLSQMLASNTSDTTAEKIFQALLDRERLGSTVLGKGVVIPHAKLPDITHTISAMMTLKQPINFDTADDQPIDIAFALLVPEENRDRHSQHLLQLTTLFRNADVCKKIRATINAEEIFNILLFMDS